MKTASKKPARPQRPLVIVDDERSYVELISQMIGEHLECEVHAFTRPEDALSVIGSLAPGVVVTDYFMPQIDGVEFIQRATPIVPEAAFIMISGHDLDSIEHDLRRLKRLKGRLQKPFGWRPLADAVLEAWPGADAPKLRL